MRKMLWLPFLLYLLTQTKRGECLGGVLYPRNSESREVRSLDGIWNFILDPKEDGIPSKWYQKDIEKMPGSMRMPVPSSYNDITTNPRIRDYVGIVWYECQFFVPTSWKTQNFRVWLRFGSVHYRAQVFVNGNNVMVHQIGHLPFQAEITKNLKFGAQNKLTVGVRNELSITSIPQGDSSKVHTLKGEEIKYHKYSHDFFNYAGIHRSVHLYTTPQLYIDDVALTTHFMLGKAYIRYNISYRGHTDTDKVQTLVQVIDKDGHVVCFDKSLIENSDTITGEMELSNYTLWWPYLMNSNPGYLNTVEISLNSDQSSVTDVYRLKYGLRNLEWTGSSLSINGKPIYFRGIGSHEDYPIRGNGLDLPTAMRDHELLKWIGVNSYHSAHIPIAEEVLDLSDEQGFMVIIDTPSVNTQFYADNRRHLATHKDAVAELINRDKNRACVIMWSLANEPRTGPDQTVPQYFKSLLNFARSLDNTRPMTAMITNWITKEQVAPLMDVICLDRLYGWYLEAGQLEAIQPQVKGEVHGWWVAYDKPIIWTEYGAGGLTGFHSLPEAMWSEEYQAKLMSEYFKVFDILRKEEWFIGEMIWAFADYMTSQNMTRPGGNRKGIFTRGREPKSAAFLLRSRYFKLAHELDEITEPDDLLPYIWTPKRMQQV